MVRDGDTWRDVIRKLTKAGYELKRNSGGHAVYSDGRHSVTVVIHKPKQRVAPNTVKNINKQTKGEQPFSWGSQL